MHEILIIFPCYFYFPCFVTFMLFSYIPFFPYFSPFFIFSVFSSHFSCFLLFFPYIFSLFLFRLHFLFYISLLSLSLSLSLYGWQTLPTDRWTLFSRQKTDSCVSLYDFPSTQRSLILLTLSQHDQEGKKEGHEEKKEREDRGEITSRQ